MQTTNSINYIPTDLEDAVRTLKDNMTAKDLETFKGEDNPSKYHFFLGMTLRNNWGLWHKSRLAHWFFDTYKIWHADDMSGIILDALHCELNGKEFDIEAEVSKYLKHWKEYGKEKAEL